MFCCGDDARLMIREFWEKKKIMTVFLERLCLVGPVGAFRDKQ